MGKGICSVEDCVKATAKRGMCNTHYQRQRVADAGPCSVEACPRPVKCRGWCNRHYLRWLRRGGTADRPTSAERGCLVKGCGEPHEGHGLCRKHRERQRAEEGRPAPEAVSNLPGEHWLPVPDYEGFYEVSDLGRMRSLSRESVHSNGVRVERQGQMLRLGVSTDGYRKVTLCVGSVRKTANVHRIVLMAFVGPPPPNTEGCHNDGDPGNNRLDNLRWDTMSANQQDKVRHGRHYNASKSSCPEGHLLQGPNLLLWGERGWRACRTCSLTKAFERREVKKGHTFDAQAYAAQKYAEIMESAHDPRRVAP